MSGRRSEAGSLIGMLARTATLFLLISFTGLIRCSTDYTVYYDEESSSFSLAKGIDQNRGVAFGSFEVENMNITGWANLSISTSPDTRYNDTVKSLAVGYLEGALCNRLIFDYQDTFLRMYPNNTATNLKVAQWFQKNLDFIISNVESYGGGHDEYWTAAGLLVDQLRGLWMGYNDYAPSDRRFSLLQLYMLNSGGDLMAVAQALQSSLMPDWSSMNRMQAELASAVDSHCSAFITVDVSSKEAYFAHTTWSMYNSMLRVFKHYSLHYSSLSEHHAHYTSSFSSYPGILSSTDDFYALGSGLVVLETTNNIYNASLFEDIVIQSMMSWMRVLISNMLTETGKDWTVSFGRLNSGTYNNQWMVVDTKILGDEWNSVPNDTLWIAEQIPGLVMASDVSDILARQGYWASFNIPYFEEIYEMSGYSMMEEKFGSVFSYDDCPRANIFRRDGPGVIDMNGVKALMQSNNWQTDPLSLNSPANAISSRYDLLNSTIAMPFGGIDSKAVDLKGVRTREVHAISGPTHQRQAVFAWDTEQWDGQPHSGQPDEFNFDWVIMKPKYP